MFYSILLNLKSLFLYRKRYLVSQILTFTALGFVVLTAAKVIAAHSEVADFANTNIILSPFGKMRSPRTSPPLSTAFGNLPMKTTSSRSLRTRPGKIHGCWWAPTHLWMKPGINRT